jgi:transcriptional regulator with XRE-family HTH domain
MGTIGGRVRQVRESLGWSCTELAEKAKTTKQNIYKYELDRTKNIPYSSVKVLAEVLNVNPAWLVGWSSHKERNAYIDL